MNVADPVLVSPPTQGSAPSARSPLDQPGPGRTIQALQPASTELADSLTAIVGWASRNDVQTEVMRRAHCSLPISHIWLLVRIANSGPCHPSDLAVVSGVDNSTITPKLQRLEAEDLLGRRSDPADRRAALVHITPAGIRLLKRIRIARAQLVVEAMAGLTPERRNALESALSELAAVLGDAGRCGEHMRATSGCSH
ncbi:MAG: MarR family transcriptional regulator [Candidatus Dormibacteraeota bacterium]|nr:MarR family transcriptional regulator [Candidatus Dormibacteraeota bacterium]